MIKLALVDPRAKAVAVVPTGPYAKAVNLTSTRIEIQLTVRGPDEDWVTWPR